MKNKKLKVAVISVYRDGTGYAKAAQNIIECLDSVGIIVVPIWTTLCGTILDTSKKIDDLEKNNLEDIDLVIQINLPTNFVKIKNIPCIGLFFWETSHFKSSNWQYNCNLMDEIWVTTREQEKSCLDSKVKTLVREIDFPQDSALYEKEYKDIDFKEYKNRYKFYSIGEISHRKNMGGLINTYYSNFSIYDNVLLVIKGYVNNMTVKQSIEYFKGMVNNIKEEMRLPHAPPIIMIHDIISNEDMCRIHKTCDCYVSSSRGEGWGLPIFDAIAFKNRVIAPNHSGPRKILESTNNTLVSVFEKPLLGIKNTMLNLYNKNESWYEPSLIEIGDAMKKYCKEKSDNKTDLINNSKSVLQKFSYNSVGEKLKSVIEKCVSHE